MNKRLSFGMLTILAALVLGACSGNVGSSSNIPDSSSKSSTKPSSVSQEPAKGIQDVSISLGNEGEKAYITVRGTQYGYSSDNFKWAWGLKEQNSSMLIISGIFLLFTLITLSKSLTVLISGAALAGKFFLIFSSCFTTS